MDTKIALGMARSDARRISRSIDGKMEEFASSVFRTVSARFRSGKRLCGNDLKALIAETDRIVGTEMAPILRKGHHQPATRTRPKGESHERLSLHVIPRETAAGQGFEIWAFRMIAGSRRVVFDTMHTGLQFHLHTVQRVLERSDNVVEEAPVIATAKAVLAHAGRLFAAIEASKTRGCDLSIGIPFGPGMLAGTIEEEDVIPGSPVNFDRTCLDVDSGTRREMAHPFLISGHERVRKLTLRTYIPGELMRTSQAEYTDKWDDVRYDHPIIEESAADYFWPTRQLWQPERTADADLTAARAAVHDLVFDPVFRDDGSKRTKFYTPPPLPQTIAEPELRDAPAMAM